MPERAVPRARPEEMAGRPSPRGAARDFASALSAPADPAAEGNDADAPTARDPGSEGEPHSRPCDARLGSADKEPKAGASAEGSAPTAVGTSGAERMDPGLWQPCGAALQGNPVSPWPESAGPQRRGWGRPREALSWARFEAGQAKAKDGVVRDALLPAGGRCFWPVCVASVPRVSGTTFPPRDPCVTLSLLGAGWGRGLSGFVYAAGGPQRLLPRPCRVLVLLNPRGGKGKALKLFRSCVQPLLAQADVSFTLMLTGECLSKGCRELP